MLTIEDNKEDTPTKKKEGTSTHNKEGTTKKEGTITTKDVTMNTGEQQGHLVFI